MTKHTEDFHSGNQNISKWLAKSMTQDILGNYPDRAPGSSVAKHLITIKQTVEPTSCFKPLLRNTDLNVLAFSETMLI